MTSNPPQRASAVVLGLALLASGIAGRVAAAPGEAWFEGDHGQAVAAATESGRPLLIMFTARWCSGCRGMDAGPLRDPAVVDLLAARFVAMRVDVDRPEGTRLAEQHQVTVFPTFLFLPATQGVERRTSGYLDAEPLVALARGWLEGGPAGFDAAAAALGPAFMDARLAEALFGTINQLRRTGDQASMARATLERWEVLLRMMERGDPGAPDPRRLVPGMTAILARLQQLGIEVERPRAEAVLARARVLLAATDQRPARR